MAKTILLVEDDVLLLQMYQRKFQDQGFIVKTATEGRQALAAVLNPVDEPDLILLDVMIPELDGFEVLSKIKADSTARRIPVIILTDLGTTDTDKQRGLALGAVDYIVKSESTPTEIINKVKDVLEEHQGK